ncbi:MAG: PilZ domain-containing protein [Myxococcales bacterium]|nr:PilZ domain-containing protein [Myxococcales bacterium]MCB9625776.1 PilZ domain-containing protein [Sandaracinaceae bacterium]
MSDTSDSPPADADESDAEAARREQRVTINKEFESFDAFVHEYVTNISRSGAFVKSQTPLAIGTLVDLNFTVFMDDVETIHGVGEVVRVQEDPPGMGVVFRELSRYSQQLIGRLLTLPRPPAPAPTTNSSAPPPPRTEPET